jgi:hypothetical protein
MEEVKNNRQWRKKKPRKKKEKEAKDKKFKDGMAKADELEKEGKFREAWMKVPDIPSFPKKRTRYANAKHHYPTSSQHRAFSEQWKKQHPNRHKRKKLLPIIPLMKQTKKKRVLTIKTEHYVISNAIRTSFYTQR